MKLTTEQKNALKNGEQKTNILKLTDEELDLLLYKLVQSTKDENLENPKMLVCKVYHKLYDTLKEGERS